MHQIPLFYRYGCHRVLNPPGCLPQAAHQLYVGDLDEEGGPAADYEVLLDVERLNIDSASFLQMEREGGVERLGALVQDIVRERGKMHNPVTGSGGMLLGRVRRVGRALAEPHRSLRPGDPVATLVSLTLTPLRIDEVRAVHAAHHQVEVRGRAVLFASGAFARLPADLPHSVALAALDVAGAAPQVQRLVAGMRRARGECKVLVLGCGGKSGLLSGTAARRAGATTVVGVERGPGAAQAQALGVYDAVLQADATDAVALAEAALAAGAGEFDLVVSCVNVPQVEMGAILCTRDRGTVYFFSMATSFTRAALGAEGVGKDIDMLVGNGFCHEHAEGTLQLLRDEPALREIFLQRYGG